MGAKVKCKKCKKKFNLSDGREAIQQCIEACENPQCPLRHKSLSYVPAKTTPLCLPAPISGSANDTDEVVEVHEDIPIGGFISHRELKKKNGG